MSTSLPAPSVYAFPLVPAQYAPHPLPTMQEWRRLWAAWDMITTEMIPVSALLEKPIPLRNPLIFYLGHIPTFEDIHLARATGEDLTQPAYYAQIFERGIDPDVDDPQKCHAHSELPDSFPSLEEILQYRRQVCQRIERLYAGEKAERNRCVGRALWIGFEHECLHLETFLYMTLLSPNVRPPPGPKPDFRLLAKKASTERVENQWFQIPAQTFTIGFEDAESDDGPDRYYAWDNEREPYETHVLSFEAQARPVSNGEYATYLLKSRTEILPATWTQKSASTNGTNRDSLAHRDEEDHSNHAEDTYEKMFKETLVRTVYGPVPLRDAQDWPLMASYNEVSDYARWAGARIPTLHEVRSIHRHAESSRKRPKESPSSPAQGRGQDPEEIFVDLTGCNVGMQHFHPMPVTQNGDRLSGLGDMGGAWEWTSSLFAPQPNFKPMAIYPGYSADFMDGKHMAVVGGSWALPPRIAGRKTFLNWWQPNYLYPWVALRLVRDRCEGESTEKR